MKVGTTLTENQIVAIRKVASAKHIRNPFVGKRDKWYKLDAETMKAIRKLSKEIG